MNTIIDGVKNRKVLLLLGVGLSLMLGGVHVYVRTQGGDYEGSFLILDHLFDLWLVLALVTLCAAVGLWSLECLQFTLDSSLEALLFSVAIGGSCVAVSILILGFLSGLQPVLIGALIAFWLILVKSKIPCLWNVICCASVEFKNHSNAYSLTVLAVVALFMITQALLPPRDWDSLVYHLHVPMQFLQAGKIYLPVDNENVAYVQLAHMLYLPLLAAGSLAGPALLSVFYALLMGVAVFTIGLRCFDASTAKFASILIWASPMIVLVGITPRVDVTVSCYLLLAHLALLMSEKDKRLFYLSGPLFGLAIGVKLSALLYVAASAPLVMWLAWKRYKRLGLFSRDVALYGMLLLLSASPWLIKNLILLKAPLFPYFSNTRVDAWLTALDVSHKSLTGSNLTSWTVLSEIQKPFSLVDLFTSPGNLAPEAEAIFYATTPLFLVIFIGGWTYLKNFYFIGLAIPALTYFGLISRFSVTNLRYLTPVIAPLTLVSVKILVDRMASLFGFTRGLGVLALVTVFMLFPIAKAMLIWTSDPPVFAYLAGSINQDEYLLATAVPPDYSRYAGEVTYVNRILPRNSLLLMLYESRGFYFRVPVIQDNTLTNWLVLENNLSSTRCLNKTGISHVLFNMGAVKYYLNRGLSPDKLKLEEFRRFTKECLIRVAGDLDYVLYRVHE